MAEVQWYYARNDQQFGPVSAEELKKLADAGGITPDDLLWREGMDAWTTAINLRGLFGSAQPADLLTPAGLPASAEPVGRGRVSRARAAPLIALVHTTQAILWGICVMIVLVGAVLFTRAFLSANDAAEEAAAGAVFSTFFIGSYVLARAGEKLSRLLVRRSRRRSKQSKAAD